MMSPDHASDYAAEYERQYGRPAAPLANPKRDHEVVIYEGGTICRYTITVGSLVAVEARGPHATERLLPSDWEGAEFRIASRAGGPIVSTAVNVVVTGRTIRARPHLGDGWIKVAIEFLGDGEPSTISPGWWRAVEPR